MLSSKFCFLFLLIKQQLKVLLILILIAITKVWSILFQSAMFADCQQLKNFASNSGLHKGLPYLWNKQI